MVGPIRRAEILSVGSELLAGRTLDTNGGELAHALAAAGVVVTRLVALPDDEEEIAAALRTALARADLVVTTGGLGPTPDDLTREAIAAVCGEDPAVDPGLAAWLHELFARRGLALPQANFKQAWVIPSARPIPNDQGTAPGWWVEPPGGGLIVALPGPPAEMRPMWRGWVWPRLVGLGLGDGRRTLTLRTAGIGESQIVELLGPELMGRPNPRLATYARLDGVDVEVVALSQGGDPEAILEEAARELRRRLGDHVWGTGTASWPEVLGELLERLGWRLALGEAGTDGAATTLLGGTPGLVLAELLSTPPGDVDREPRQLQAWARRLRRRGSAAIALVLTARRRGEDTAMVAAVEGPGISRREASVAFLHGPQGARRAAVLAAHLLWRTLREAAGDGRGDPKGSPGNPS
jgi:nicotinamide-nucleotide amidase